MRTTWRANALPSFVAGGTKTACMRQPLIVTHASGLTRAVGYQAGPFTTFASLWSAPGEAVSTRCWSGVVLEPTTHPRHDGAQPPIPAGPMMWSAHVPGPFTAVSVSPSGTFVGHGTA